MTTGGEVLGLFRELYAQELITATGGWFAVSRDEIPRPLTSAMPIVSKYPGAIGFTRRDPEELRVEAVDAVDEADPLTIRRDEGGPQGAAGGDRHRGARQGPPQAAGLRARLRPDAKKDNESHVGGEESQCP